MATLKSSLEKKIKSSLANNFGIENYDEYRFGKYSPNQSSLTKKIKSLLKKIVSHDKRQFLKLINNYELKLQYIWENINEESKNLIVTILAYKALGYTKIKLPTSTSKYWQFLEQVKTLKDPLDTYNSGFLHFVLEKFNLKPIGYDIILYFSDIGIVCDFMLEQYAYKEHNKTIVSVEKGDYVLDIGGCWGDTALYFSHKAGNTGKVFSFEFIPNNIKLHQINTGFNPHLNKNIHLIPYPVSNISNETIYFKDNGPASIIQLKPFEGQTGSVATISIDDYIEKNNIEKVDFIKMDIEGAETVALAGAIKTIQKFRPKLAIAIYHSMEDFASIPKWILDLKLDYEIFIGHFTIHAEETICFAKPKTIK